MDQEEFEKLHHRVEELVKIARWLFHQIDPSSGDTEDIVNSVLADIFIPGTLADVDTSDHKEFWDAVVKLIIEKGRSRRRGKVYRTALRFGSSEAAESVLNSLKASEKEVQVENVVKFVESVIADLGSEKHRQIASLWLLQNRSIEEVANQLQIPYSTCARIIAQIRLKVEEEVRNFEDRIDD